MLENTREKDLKWSMERSLSQAQLFMFHYGAWPGSKLVSGYFIQSYEIKSFPISFNGLSSKAAQIVVLLWLLTYSLELTDPGNRMSYNY